MAIRGTLHGVWVANGRKPGDYVVNAELTDAQRQRFVDDCVSAGADNRTGTDPDFGLTLWDTDDMSDVSEYPLECAKADDVRNVTHHYQHQTIDTQRLKTDPAYWDEVAPVGATHFREGYSCYRSCWLKGDGRRWLAMLTEDDYSWDEVHTPHNTPDAIFKRPEPDTLTDLRRRVAHLEAQLSEAGRSDEQATERVPTEDDVGRLVLVRDEARKEWAGPCVLHACDGSEYPFAAAGDDWKQAKLYEGPTRPNWVEHDGRGVPEAVREAGGALVLRRNGTIEYTKSFGLTWSDDGDGYEDDITHYTIINP